MKLFPTVRVPVALVMAATIAAPPMTSNAILLRDDKDLQAAVNLAQRFPAVGHFPGCSGTLISPTQVITAAHCIDGSVPGSPFRLGPSAANPTHVRTIVGIAKNPKSGGGGKTAFDIAIITLDQPITDVVPMTLSGARRIGKTGIVVGFGDTGNGLRKSHKNGHETKRAAQNRIDVLVPSNFKPEKADRGAIYTDFDSPDKDGNTLRTEFGFKSSSSPLSLEGDAGPGDSGGPLISGGAIVGIVSAGFNDIGTDAQYGTTGIYAALVQPGNIAWLESQGIAVAGRGSNAGSSASSSKSSKRSNRSSRSEGPQFGALRIGNGLIYDQGAIRSAVFSGLPMANAMEGAGLRAASVGTRDLNARLTRLRGRSRTSQAIFGGTREEGTARLSQFLAFTNAQGIDAAEALGLNDDVELPTATAFFGGGPFAVAAAGPLPFPTLAAASADPGKNSIEIVDERLGVFELYASGNVGIYDQDSIGGAAGFDSETGSGAVGIEHALSDRLSIGLALGYVDSDTDIPGLGGFDAEGWALSAYASYYRNGLWGDLLYSYGQFDIDSRRLTGFGGAAVGETEAATHQIDLNLGYNFERGNLVHGPIFELNYLTGETDSYREFGGGAANLIYDGTDSDSLTTLLGWQTTWSHKLDGGLLTAQLRAGWGHEHVDEGSDIGVSLARSPFLLYNGSSPGTGFGASSTAARPGSDYVSVGGGLDFSTGSQFFIGIDYETRLLWDNASEHFGSLRAGYRF